MSVRKEQARSFFCTFKAYSRKLVTMKKIKKYVVYFFLIWGVVAVSHAQKHDPVVLVIHGGAGTITKERLSPERERDYISALTMSLEKGYKVLQEGGTSVEAVEQAIHVLEDSPLFNAGKGAVFTHEGKNELDASVMEGSTSKAGAVAGVKTVKNPISAAVKVMQKSDHVMLTGEGAERFAEEAGLEIVRPEYFYTNDRWEDLQRVREASPHQTARSERIHEDFSDEKFGTVGCVALDQFGGLAAGTSTGGMTNKKYGRVGDSPIIGAGTYANARVGVSCTGWGEYFIRAVAAYEVAARMEFLDEDIEVASRKVIEKIENMGGNGGLIALDSKGNVAMPFTTKGMFRGTITKGGSIEVKLYGEE